MASIEDNSKPNAVPPVQGGLSVGGSLPHIKNIAIWNSQNEHSANAQRAIKCHQTRYLSPAPESGEIHFLALMPALFDLRMCEDEAQRIKIRWMRDNIKTLQGKNVACFCKEGTACHADALLELANA